MPRGRGRKRKSEEEPEIIRLSSDEQESGNFPKNPFEALLRAASRSEKGFLEAERTSEMEFNLPDSAFRCADDTLTMHVTRDCIQKIWSGEYLNLALLLRKGSDQQISAFSVNESGQVELKPKPAKAVQNIREWTDAFLIFSAILIKKIPEKAPELLQYMSLIREAESRSKGSFAWRTYDENFRMRQAIRPESWAKINPDLWLWSMTLPALSQPTSTSRMNTNPHPVKQRVRPCFDYNSVKGCSFRQCKYDHMCMACRGAHAQTNCPRVVDNFRNQDKLHRK